MVPSSHHTWISHLTYGPKQPTPAESSWENIPHSTRHTSPTDTKSSLLRSKPNYDRLCSTLLLKPYRHLIVYMWDTLGRVYRLTPRTRQTTKESKEAPKFPSQEAQTSLSLSCWPYPLLIPSTYHYTKIPNKSTHGIVYHVKPASPQLPASWGVTLATKCPAGFLSVVIILKTLKKA